MATKAKKKPLAEASLAFYIVQIVRSVAQCNTEQAVNYARALALQFEKTGRPNTAASIRRALPKPKRGAVER
jgi:hypothetical protein